MRKQILKNAIDLKFQQKVCVDILEICQPIIKFFGVNFFAQTRAFHDGHFASLMTDPDLTDFFVKKKFPIRFSQGKGWILESGFYLQNFFEYSRSPISDVLREKFNTAYFIYIIERNQEYDDMFAFATTPDNSQVINRYINNLDILKHFILYYKDKASHLINKSTLSKYSNEYFYESAELYTSQLPLLQKKRSQCLTSMPLRKIIIAGDSGNVRLSKREFDCFHYIVKNYTYKEIAKILNLSPRTVETYANNLKSKLGCNKRSDLIQIYENFYTT